MHSNLSRQQGAALLAILAMVIAVIAVVATANLSVNTLKQDANQKSTSALQEARKALLGYALNSIPPGQLPCPDNTGDGVGDISGGNCSTALGRFPYRDVMATELRDGYNSHLWYSLNQNLRVGSSTTKNSSTSTVLNLDGTALAAIIIAPNRALNNQARNNNSPVTDYLEGVNANANTNNYSRVVDDQHNDILLAIENQAFWNLIEESVLKRIANYLNQYRNSCGFYPWAASAGMPPYNSVDTLQQGHIPFNSALPDNWNTGCAVGINPDSWMATQWGGQIYYAFCTSAEGNCLSITGDQAASSAALILAPGVRLSGQTRATFTLAEYYENLNATANNNFFMRLNKNFDGSFNDVLLSLSP